jgi:hypothetical protein
MEMSPVSTGGQKEKKSPSVFRVKHADMPDVANAAPGDEVELHGKGHVVSNRAPDEFGDGEAEIHMHHVEHKGTKKGGVDEGKKKKKNAAHMPIDELKKVIEAQGQGDGDGEYQGGKGDRNG